MMNNLDKDYLDILSDILTNGRKKETRNGNVLSLFGKEIRHDMSNGFPLLTTKKIFWKSFAVELLWFLRGDTNIRFLVQNKCNIWNGDAWENYKKKCKHPGVHSIEDFASKISEDEVFAKYWGELGPVYGSQWRNWCGDKTSKSIDQIKNVIDKLQTNPDDRRLLVSTWNVGQIENMVLPPCHYGFQLYSEELTHEEKWSLLSKDNIISPYDDNIKLAQALPNRRLHLKWTQRSCDFPLGIPANIFSYGLLLSLIAKQVKMIPGTLMGSFGDCHIYINQIDAVKEQISRQPFNLPNLIIENKNVEDISEYEVSDFKIENYNHHPKIFFPLSN